MKIIEPVPYLRKISGTLVPKCLKTNKGIQILKGSHNPNSLVTCDHVGALGPECDKAKASSLVEEERKHSFSQHRSFT